MNTFRDYTKNAIVEEQYKQMRQNQTYDFAKARKEENITRLQSSGLKIKVIDAINLLNTFIDKSDPDMSHPNIYHFYQTAEKLRNDGQSDWLQLVKLIHDLGKMMYLFGKDEYGTSMSTQWSIVGDTYILGCALRNQVYPQFDTLCPDMSNPNYNTVNGIYKDEHGLSNCVFSYGHDEYLYDVLKYNKEIGNISNKFPTVGYDIIRFHSLYPWHWYGEYTNFEDEKDKETKKYVQLFNKYDLYTKSNDLLDIEELNKYYLYLIKKYFINDVLVF